MTVQQDIRASAAVRPETGCNICGKPGLEEIESFPLLPRVTSDSKPWPAGGSLVVCRSCGAVQKISDATWLGEIDAIYGGYTLYHQADGAEQPIFCGAGEAPLPHSTHLANRIDATLGLPEKIDMLDFGCGTGSALRTFSNQHPEWTLHGSELSDVNLPRLRSISGFAELFTCPPDHIPKKFDLITLIHSLEHVLDPVGTLAALSKRLKPGGYIFVQVPDCGRTPYDLVIADHLSHFSLASLAYAGALAGCRLVEVTDSVLPKELTWVGSTGTAGDPEQMRPDAGASVARVKAQVEWLKAQVDDALRISAASAYFGILGTSISGTWLQGLLGDRVHFFVDEDPGRIGKTHRGLPILSPTDLPADADVYVPLIPQTASRVVTRLDTFGVRAHAPPFKANIT